MDITLFIIIVIVIVFIYYLINTIKDLQIEIKNMSISCNSIDNSNSNSNSNNDSNNDSNNIIKKPLETIDVRIKNDFILLLDNIKNYFI